MRIAKNRAMVAQFMVGESMWVGVRVWSCGQREAEPVCLRERNKGEAGKRDEQTGRLECRQVTQRDAHRQANGMFAQDVERGTGERSE